MKYHNVTDVGFGESALDFYRRNGISGRREQLLDGIRNGDYNALSKISGIVPVIRGVFNIDAVLRTGFIVNRVQPTD